MHLPSPGLELPRMPIQLDLIILNESVYCRHPRLVTPWKTTRSIKFGNNRDNWLRGWRHITTITPTTLEKPCISFQLSRVILWLDYGWYYPYLSGLLHWHWHNLTIWVNDAIATMKPTKAKACTCLRVCYIMPIITWQNKISVCGRHPPCRIRLLVY